MLGVQQEIDGLDDFHGLGRGAAVEVIDEYDQWPFPIVRRDGHDLLEVLLKLGKKPDVSAIVGIAYVVAHLELKGLSHLPDPVPRGRYDAANHPAEHEEILAPVT